MLISANCKINIGLDILERRTDGYHNINTLMVPVQGLCDNLEIEKAGQSSLVTAGMYMECHTEENLCMKALRLMQQECGAGEASIKLFKAIPSGAGLGGGSSDAAAVIKGVNQLFGLGLDDTQMESLAAKIGSDVPFFINNRPAIVSGKGDIMTPDNNIMSRLAGKHLIILKPDVSISTARAYGAIKPYQPAASLEERLAGDISTWRDNIGNLFEKYVLSMHPYVGVLKWALYEMGAVYASMSGSGSALYGIFNREPRTYLLPEGLYIYQQIMHQ